MICCQKNLGICTGSPGKLWNPSRYLSMETVFRALKMTQNSCIIMNIFFFKTGNLIVTATLLYIPCLILTIWQNMILRRVQKFSNSLVNCEKFDSTPLANTQTVKFSISFIKLKSLKSPTRATFTNPNF